jgi:hypothetical protein
MLRFTIRELFVLTVTVGIAVGWWLDHRATAVNAEAAKDAKFLAQVAEHGCHCQMVDQYIKLREKYGVESAFRFDADKWNALSEEFNRKRRAVAAQSGH